MLVKQNGKQVGIINNKTMVLTISSSDELTALYEQIEKDGMAVFSPGAIRKNEESVDRIVTEKLSPENKEMLVHTLERFGYEVE